MSAPRKAARGREQDRLIVYLVLTGNATLSTAEYLQLTSQTASKFFESPGALTSAMRSAAEALNRTLLNRNMSSTGQGQYAVGWLVMAALRGVQCTLLQSGPSHIYKMDGVALQHTHDPALSGKGLGLSQAATLYFTQSTVQPGNQLLFSGKPPAEWEQVLRGEQGASIEAIRRHLFSLSQNNVNAVLIQVQEGTGVLTVLRPAPSKGGIPKDTFPESEASTPPAQAENLPPQQQPDTISQATPSDPEPETAATEFTPAAYSIPPVEEDEAPPEIEEVVPEFPTSIPRDTSKAPSTDSLREMDTPIMDEPPEVNEPHQPSETTRQVARGLVSGMRTSRHMGNAFSRNFQKFLPNLLPESNDPSQSSSIMMIVIAILIPLLVVTAGVTVYMKYGLSIEYDDNFRRAEEAYNQAITTTDPARQRDWWDRVLFYLDKAEFYRTTPELETMREEAQANRDELLSIQRLNFFPAFSGGVNAQISRLAANEIDLFMLDAERGRVLHASQVGSNFEMDEAFRCGPGDYGEYQVGPIVDILILPRLNSLNASVLGIDAGGNLLYCSPRQVGQAIPLAVPDTNWGRVTGFTLDGSNLYVLDASSRAIWVYTGQDASFLDRPYFFFGGQIPEIDDSIDLVVSSDELYLLHADGHISTCSYSRLDTVPTRCEDPATIVNPIPAYQDIDLFEQAHITQIIQTSPPDLSLLMLDADNRNILRISPRTLELRDQIHPMPGSSLPQRPAGAMTVNPNRVLFLAVGDQVYFATDMP